MGYYYREGFGPNYDYKELGLNKEIMDDLNKQVDFHKQKLLEENIDLVENVLKSCMVSLLEDLPSDKATASTPMLTAIMESLIELRGINEVLAQELINLKIPPQDGFEFN